MWNKAIKILSPQLLFSFPHLHFHTPFLYLYSVCFPPVSTLSTPLLFTSSPTQRKREGDAGLDAEKEMRWNNYTGNKKAVWPSSLLNQASRYHTHHTHTHLLFSSCERTSYSSCGQSSCCIRLLTLSCSHPPHPSGLSSMTSHADMRLHVTTLHNMCVQWVTGHTTP